MCWGNPFGFNVFKYSVLNRKVSAGFSKESALLSLIPVPGRLACIMSFILSTSLLVGARMARPSNQPGML